MQWFKIAACAAFAVAAAGCNPNSEPAAPSPPIDMARDIGPDGLKIWTALSAFPTAQASINDLSTVCLEVTGHDQTLSVRRSVTSPTPLSAAMSRAGRYLLVPADRYSDAYLYDMQCSTYAAAVGDEPSPLTTELAETLTSGSGSVDTVSYASAAEVSTFAGPSSQLELAGSFTFDGAERPARLLFVGGRLSAARISFGAFSETKLQQLITALDERYALIDPSEAEFRDYDALHRSCVGFATQDRSVALSVARTQQARINNWVGELWVTYASPDAPRRLVSSECFPAAALPHSDGGL